MVLPHNNATQERASNNQYVVIFGIILLLIFISIVLSGCGDKQNKYQNIYPASFKIKRTVPYNDFVASGGMNDAYVSNLSPEKQNEALITQRMLTNGIMPNRSAMAFRAKQ